MMASRLLKISIDRNKNKTTPEHHVIAKSVTSWASYLPSWPSGSNKEQSSEKDSQESQATEIASFKNPWPSYHRPTRQEMWDSLAFGADEDPSIALAASHVPGTDATDSSKTTRDKQAAYLLKIEKPDFSFDADKCKSKSTWLGHASMLLQLSALTSDRSPIRVLFDPIFSMRCSPSQSVGPIRSYLPPCKIEDLPQIDIVLISHNHYDHLDYDTIRKLWKLHGSNIRFIVPLKTRKWFLDFGIEADRVEELDWWDSASITSTLSGEDYLRITCTPAQHSSGRDGADADMTLWSSWYLEHIVSAREPYRIFFAGDSGYQFHGSSAWPPKPPKQSSQEVPSSSKEPVTPGRLKMKRALSRNKIDRSPEDYPPCPAFEEIVGRLGSPHLLYLPLALGATWAYFKSFFSDYLPDSLDPFPSHSPGVSGAVHMPPWDAVRVLQVMTQGLSAQPESEPPIAIGMHWGTFVTDKSEVLKTLGQLEWACDQQDVLFSRSMKLESDIQDKRARFLALNHGQSVTI